MDYGKTAYLKVLDLEKELSFLHNSEKSSNNYLEVSKPNINQTYSFNSVLNIDLPNINVTRDKSICFEIKITLTSKNEGETNFELIVDDCILYHELKNISIGETDVFLIKTYTPITTTTLKSSIRITSNTENFSAIINSITAVIIGAEGENLTSEIEMRAIEIPNENKVLISFIDDQKLYYHISQITERSLRYSDFTYLLPAISHCFCLETFPSDFNKTPDIILYRIDQAQNLYMSKIFEGEGEKLIETNVSCVYACPCPLVSDNTNLIAYIKNDDCYFRTIRDDSIISEKKFSLPQGEYKDIRVVSKNDSEFLYVIATHSNGSNYIMRSLVEVSTGKIVEFLSATYMLALTKYIDVSFVNKKATEHLNLDFACIVESLPEYSQIIERLTIEHITADFNLQPEIYKVSPKTIYGVKLDKSILTGTEWASYTDGASEFEGAYMDFANDVFVDNGWTNRWPFNQIKPCLVKNGEVVGYLNPNNYAEFIDGTSSNITNLNNGIVMIEIPKIYYNITRDENFIKIQICNQPQENFVCKAFTYKGEELDKIYISAYLCGPAAVTTQGFNTPSGVRLNSSQLVGYEKNYDVLKNLSGERFEFLPFNVLILIQCLFTIMFKSTNSQASLGYGYNQTQSSYFTGKLDAKGLYYGKGTQGTGTKFMGMEDLYACRNVTVTGFYIDADSKPRFIDPYDPNSSYDPDTLGDYITSSLPYTISTSALGVTTDIHEDANNLGFFPLSKTSGATTLGFCDSSSQRRSSTCCVFGSNGTLLNNGIFSMTMAVKNTNDTLRSVRLVYYPQPTK